MFSDALILVAGADSQDRETILQAFGDHCHVVAAQTSQDALAHLSDEVDLVVAEAATPRFNGFDLLRNWKAQRSQTPFLMLIGDRDVVSAVEAMKNGAADCVLKPIDPAALRATAGQVINAGISRSANGSARELAGHHRRSGIDIPPDTSLEDLERAAVEQALVQHHGNRTHAARTLGISVRTLQRKLKAWGMPIVSFPNSPANANFPLPTQVNAPHVFSAHAH